MRKTLTVILTLCFLLSLGAPAFAADFFGVNDWERYCLEDGDFYWCRDDLKLAVASELFRGVPPAQAETLMLWKGCGGVNTKILGDLKPDATISRGEYAAIVCRALDLEGAASLPKSPFSDVKGDEWYAGPILRLVKEGIINPSDYGAKLNPKGPITRLEIAVWMARAAEHAGIQAQPGALNFSDVKASAPHAAEVAKAVGLSIIKGYSDGTFRPQATATRAEAAVMLVRLVKLLPLFSGIDAQSAKQQVQEVADAMTAFCESWPVNQNAGWEPNPGFEAALARFQAGMKDKVTDYNLWPRTEPEGLNTGTLAKRGEVGPRCDWGGLEAGYGLIDGMLLRTPSFGIPAVCVQENVHLSNVAAFVGRGPIAEISLTGSTVLKYIDGEEVNRPDDGKGDIRALFVKQGGKWKIAALYADGRGPWLKLIGFAQ